MKEARRKYRASEKGKKGDREWQKKKYESLTPVERIERQMKLTKRRRVRQKAERHEELLLLRGESYGEV